jgi:hypothetical protein
MDKNKREDLEEAQCRDEIMATSDLIFFLLGLTSYLTHSQLLARFKSESTYKIAEGGRVKAHSLAHNTLRGRRVCWSLRMGLERVVKLHSLTWACTQPTQGG